MQSVHRYFCAFAFTNVRTLCWKNILLVPNILASMFFLSRLCFIFKVESAIRMNQVTGSMEGVVSNIQSFLRNMDPEHVRLSVPFFFYW